MYKITAENLDKTEETFTTIICNVNISQTMGLRETIVVGTERKEFSKIDEDFSVNIVGTNK